MESISSIYKFCNSKCGFIFNNISNVITYFKRNYKNYTWCIIFLLFSIAFSYDYFPTYLEVNTTYIKIPLFTNSSNKIFNIQVDDKIFNISVERCKVTYFEYNITNFVPGGYKVFVINNKTVFVKFSNESKDIYEELFRNAVCYERFEYEKERDILTSIKNKNNKTFLPQDLLKSLMDNIIYIITIITATFIILAIYFFKKYTFL